jgi:short-subunit dehydrogenase
MKCLYSILEKDIRGRVCLVTGANQGLGLEVSKELAKRGCTLLMVCRDEAKGKAAVEVVQQETDNKDVHLKICDLSSLSQIHNLAHELSSKGTRLFLLVNNAGVMVRILCILTSFIDEKLTSEPAMCG